MSLAGGVASAAVCWVVVGCGRRISAHQVGENVRAPDPTFGSSLHSVLATVLRSRIVRTTAITITRHSAQALNVTYSSLKRL